MGILEWIKNNEEILVWAGGTIVAIYKFTILFYKRVYKPCYELLNKIKYEINNNGGKSIKDLVEKINESITKLSAMNDAMLSISEQCIFKCSSDGRCTFANESLCELYGATQEEMMGFGWINFLLQSERDDNEKNWKRAIENDSSVSSEYTVVHGITGEKIPCYYKAAIKRDSTGKIVSILGIVHKKNKN